MWGEPGLRARDHQGLAEWVIQGCAVGFAARMISRYKLEGKHKIDLAAGAGTAGEQDLRR